MEIKMLKLIIDVIVALLTGKGDYMNDAIEAGCVDYSGQGRDKWGH